MKHLRTWLLFILFLIPVALYTVYSYALVDPNLVMSTHPAYWSFQQQMWLLGYHQRDLSARLYFWTVLGMFGAYGFANTTFRAALQKHGLKLFALLVLLLIVAYPALSHDLFNYMFNAKMVVVYQHDPHVHTALEFVRDPWLRFMNNVHTPAPYGYGWTALSLIPYNAGFHKFLTTYFSFKLFMVLGLFAVYKIQSVLGDRLKDPQFRWKRWLFFLNPLVLVETVGNVHNDIWMMALYFGAFLLLVESHRKKPLTKKVWVLVGSVTLFVLSSSIKFATVALAPVYAAFLVPPASLHKILRKALPFWADISALIMLLPLFTARSQQFHPWYLVWSLAFLPFARSALVRTLLIGLSISSMLRYFPYISTGGYSPESFMLERQITWVGGIGFFIALRLANKFILKRSPMLE